jgi:hypothetical protein
MIHAYYIWRPDDMEKPPNFKPKPRTPESTLAFKIKDPGAETLILPKTGRLLALRERLSWYNVSESADPAGFNFEAFCSNLDKGGLGTIKSDDWAFEVVLSSSRSLFLLCRIGPTEVGASFVNLNKSLFENFTALHSDSFPPLYLYRITSSDLTALETIAGNTAENVRKRLAGSQITEVTDNFDLEAFVKQISEVSGFFDANDNFLIAIGGEDFVYRLYVNPGQIRDKGSLVCKFTNNGESYVLIRSEFIE